MRFSLWKLSKSTANGPKRGTALRSSSQLLPVIRTLAPSKLAIMTQPSWKASQSSKSRSRHGDQKADDTPKHRGDQAKKQRGDVGGHELLSAMRKLSLGGERTQIHVPPLSSYASSGVAIAGKAVKVGQAVRKAVSTPNSFDSPHEYAKAMQAHTQREFEASVRQGAASADRLPGGGWLTLRGRRKGVKVKYMVDGTPRRQEERKTQYSHDFTISTWSRHMVQVEGFKVPAFVIHCEPQAGLDHQAFLTVSAPGGTRAKALPPLEEDLDVRVRSLGYVGSFFLEFGSAANLLRQSHKKNALLRAVASPGSQGEQARANNGGTFVPAANTSELGTSEVPLDFSQRDAVLNLTGSLDVIVGPPGTGKSTTIYHIIHSRVASDARVLVTSIRNQAVDAISRKVAPLGILVFGSEARLGPHAKDFTIEGRLRNDPELEAWRLYKKSWGKQLQAAKKVSWSTIYLSQFPGLKRLHRIETQGLTAGMTFPKKRDKTTRLLKIRGRAAGRWVFVLKHVLRQVYEARLKNGTPAQKQTFRQQALLDVWKDFLFTGYSRAIGMLLRLERLIRYRIYTTTRVLLCTVHSTNSMLRSMKRGTTAAAQALGRAVKAAPVHPALDTVIVDEAGCVLETAIPMVLALGVKNLTLVGDHHQLQPFSHLTGGKVKAGTNASRSLMERAIDAGAETEFLSTQYRMHPRICEVVSRTFYEGKLFTAPKLEQTRSSPTPCQWVHISGGEVKHQDKGYSNPAEVPIVVQQARAALQRYGAHADIRVITFYNMQKLALERKFNRQRDLARIRIGSVDSCQGSDADVVIISTVRSGGCARQLSGFMLDPRRVNVALSRAKEECIIVGDKDTLRLTGVMWRTIVKHYTKSSSGV